MKVITDNRPTQCAKTNSSTHYILHRNAGLCHLIMLNTNIAGGRVIRSFPNRWHDMTTNNRALVDGVSSFHIDFQKNLLCPKLTCSDHYYASKLTVYGFGVHSGESSKGTVYLWPETIAPKNPDTLLSCLDIHLRETEEKNRRWNIFWADNTVSQNKNFTVVFYFEHLVSSGFRNRIDYKFLIAGHSYGDVDRDSGRAESIIRNEEKIETPKDYVDLINGSILSPKITWIEMKEQCRFKAFSRWLRTKFRDIRKDIHGCPFLITEMSYLNFGIGERVDTDGTLKTFSHPNIVWMRKCLDPYETPIQVDFRIPHRELEGVLRTNTLAALNEGLIKLKDKKCTDLKRLSKFLSESGRQYYVNIRSI